MIQKFSLVCPVYNEFENIEPLVEEIFASLADVLFEVIIIDDGSTDETWSNMTKLRERYPIIRIFQNRVRRGKTHALWCGFEKARSDIIATIDGDGQDCPAELLRLHQRLLDWNDMVIGAKVDRKDRTSKLVASHLFNFMMNFIFRTSFRDQNCGMKIFHAKVLRNIECSRGLHRFLAAYAYTAGFSVAEVDVEHRKRWYGESKYGCSRLFHFCIDLFKFSLIFKLKAARKLQA